MAWEDFVLVTEHIRFSIPTLEIFVDTPFEASWGSAKVRGEVLHYSFARRQGFVENASLTYALGERGELFFRGKRLEYTAGTWRGEGILCTGCRREPPLVSLRAKEATVFPEGKVVIKGLALYVREKKILEIPWYTRTFTGEGGFLLPAFGFSREKGWYTGFRYEYALSPETLFLVRYTLGSRKGQKLQTDLIVTGDSFTGWAFWDTRFSGEDSFGAVATLRSGDFSLSFLGTHNEEVGSHTLSRSPQIVASFEKSAGSSLALSGKLSYGYFATETVQDNRLDARLNLSLKGENTGATVFGWGTLFGSGERTMRWGAEVFWEKDLSPEFWTRFRWRFVEGEASPFFFDPTGESTLTLECLLGDVEESFLRLRGRYDLNAGAFRDWTFGIGIGSGEMSLGIEGVYSPEKGTLTEKRYFLRRNIEDCVSLELSFFDPEGSLFVAMNFSGFDKPQRSESLFDEEEPFDPLSFRRETDTP